MMKSIIITILLLLGLIIAPLSTYTAVGSQPYLEVEESYTITTSNIELTGLYTDIQGTNAYTDVISGRIHSLLMTANSPKDAYALRYDNGNMTWNTAINAVDYDITTFNSVYNYTFAGSVTGLNTTNSLIVKLNPTTGAPECYTIFSPGQYMNSKITAITYNSLLGKIIIVGTLNHPEPLIPSNSYNNRGFIATIDPINCTLDGSAYVSKQPTTFEDVAVNNNASSPYYGYTAIVGKALDASGEWKAYILIVSPSQNIELTATFNTSNPSQAKAVSIYRETFIVGGTIKSASSIDGFILRMDPLPNHSTAWLLNLTTTNDDAVNDITTNNGLITFTGYINKSSTNQSLITGSLYPNTTIKTLYTYGEVNAAGNSVTMGPQNKIHVVGTISTIYPNTLQPANTGLLQPQQYPPQPITLGNTLSPVDIVQYQAQLTSYDPQAGVDIAGGQGALSGLYMVIGELTPPPTTTTITITPTLTTQPTTTTVTSVINHTTPNYCIDLSTGTSSTGQPEPFGSLENILADYPDWSTWGGYPVRVSYANPVWPYNPQLPARWVSAFAYSNGSPIVSGTPHPEVTYAISFTLQTPSIIELNWTADDIGYLYLDGSLIQSASLNQGFTTLSTVLGPGSHTLAIRVNDTGGAVTGLYVSGSACPLQPVTSTPPPRPTTTTSTNPQTTLTAGPIPTGVDCPCSSTINQSLLIVGGLIIASTLIIALQVRRIK